MTIQDTHKWIYYLLTKNKSGHQSHEEIDRALDRGQMDVFNDYFGNPKSFDPQRPVAHISYGTHQAVNKVLDPFKEPLSFTNVDTPSGLLSLPDDFMYPLSAYTVVYSNTLGRSIKRPVVPVNEDELIKRLESQIAPVTAVDPIAIYNNKSMQLFPEQPHSGVLFYFRRPKAPRYVYSVSGRVETHDANASQDLEWDEPAINHVVAKALMYLGISLKSGDLISFGDAKDKQGS